MTLKKNKVVRAFAAIATIAVVGMGSVVAASPAMAADGRLMGPLAAPNGSNYDSVAPGTFNPVRVSGNSFGKVWTAADQGKVAVFTMPAPGTRGPIMSEGLCLTAQDNLKRWYMQECDGSIEQDFRAVESTFDVWWVSSFGNYGLDQGTSGKWLYIDATLGLRGAANGVTAKLKKADLKPAVADVVITSPDPTEVTPIEPDKFPLEGSAEPSSDVFIYGPDGTEVAKTTSNTEGEWKWTGKVNLAPGGPYEFTVTSVGSSAKVKVLVNLPVEITSPDFSKGDTLPPGSNTFTGTAQANTEVVITDAEGNEIGRTRSGPNGAWSVDLDLELGAGSVTATAAGRSKTVEFIVAKAPRAEVEIITPANNAETGKTNVQVTGTAEPGSTIEIVVGGLVVDTVHADDITGVWTGNVPGPLQVGINKITARDVTDDEDKPEDSVNVDVQANVPTIDAPLVSAELPKNGAKFTGTAEPSADVTVTVTDSKGAKHEIKVKADSNGNWTADLPEGVTLPGGGTNVRVDAAGKHIEQNYTAATAPTVIEKPAANDVIRVGDSIRFEGTGEPGATITVTGSGGFEEEVTVGNDGTWFFDAPASTQAGDRSFNIDGENVIVSVQPEIAKPSIITPASGEKLPLTGGTLTGTAEPGAAVVVEMLDADGKTVVLDVTVDTEGNWTAKVPEGTTLAEGKTTVTVKAAGKTETKDFDAEKRPTKVTSPTDKDVIRPGDSIVVKGTGEPNTTVDVKLPDGSTVPVDINENGEWSVDVVIPSKDTDATISINGEDIVIKVTPFDEVDITGPAKDKDLPKSGAEFTGTATPNTPVTVTVTDKNGNATVIETTADKDGIWTAKLPDEVTLPAGNTTVKVDAGGKSKTGNYVAAKTPTKVTSPTDKDVIRPGDSIVVKGTGEPNTTVDVKLPDGSTVPVDINENGEWSVDVVIPSKDTDATISINGEDIVIKVTPFDEVDITGPAKDKDLPKSGAEFTGTATPNTPVTVTVTDKNGNATVIETTADKDGIWTAKLPDEVTLPAGNTTVKVDAGGKSKTGNYVAAKAPTKVTSPTDDNDLRPGADLTIKGTGEPNTKVDVTLPNGDKVQADVDKDGNWFVDTVVPDSEDDIEFVVDGVSHVVPLAPAPIELSLKSPAKDENVSSSSVRFEGTAEPGSTVIVTDDETGAEIGRAEADSKGNWSFVVKNLPEGPLNLTVSNGTTDVHVNVLVSDDSKATPMIDPVFGPALAGAMLFGFGAFARRRKNSVQA